jgi:phospholipid/cholesterol/gamma-HCH transport system ATP-binding protein
MSIQISNITKAFGDKEVLRGVSFAFHQGEVNMIIGASGSGKSVLLKCIVGLMKPDAGQILYDGMDFLETSFREVRHLRKSMGVLFQYSALFDSMTVEENVGFPLKLDGKFTAKEIKKRVEFCLDRVNMAKTNHLYPAELSGGMMKRVGIARAISQNPKYLFCDEPNSGLDPLTAKVIDELIQEITAEFNTCTVVVSHDMNSVINISDNIMFLHEGKKNWSGNKQSIMRSGNENLDRFVFVSDLINRDVFQPGAEGKSKLPVQIGHPSLEVSPAQDTAPDSDGSSDARDSPGL